MKSVIVDDEELAIETLLDAIKKASVAIEIVGTYQNIETAYQGILNNKPTLLFLDIELNGNTSFDLLDLLNDNYHIIFVTGHNEFAIKAFKYSAIDYIEKPVSPLDILQVFNRIRKRSTPFNNIDFYKENREIEKIKKIAVSTEKETHYLTISDIIRCESDKNYTTIYLKNKTSLVISKTIKEFESMLTEVGFIRVHQTHLVNSLHVISFLKTDGAMLLLSNSDKIPVSRRKKNEIQSFLAQQ